MAGVLHFSFSWQRRRTFKWLTNTTEEDDGRVTLYFAYIFLKVGYFL